MKRTLFITICLLGLWVAAQAAPVARAASCGTTLTIRATANPGYEFVEWSDNETENPREIVISAVTTAEPYVATFKATSTPTGVEEPDAAPKARKVMIEDKLYIICGDKLYDARGAFVKKIQ